MLHLLEKTWILLWVAAIVLASLNASGTITNTEGSGLMLYDTTLAKDKSVTITDKYFSF